MSLNKISRQLEENHFFLRINEIKDYSIEEIVQAAICGGIRNIEINIKYPKALEIIKNLSNMFEERSDIVIGVSGVYDAANVRMAFMNGAKYISNFNFSVQVAKSCDSFNLVYLSNTSYLKEILYSEKYGFKVLCPNLRNLKYYDC
ncbi:hypothetical protein ACWY2R_03630 [Enterococcus avium]